MPPHDSPSDQADDATRDLDLLWHDLTAEAENYARAHEDGWFYPDAD